jgi:hypothetical protein
VTSRLGTGKLLTVLTVYLAICAGEAWHTGAAIYSEIVTGVTRAAVEAGSGRAGVRARLAKAALLS